jgi:hypothetical protein
MRFIPGFIILYSLVFTAYAYAANFTNAELDNACKKSREFNKNGKITEGYLELAKLGDSYAEAASKIFDNSKDTLERCVIQAHWLTVVGGETKDKYFDRYGKQYQSNYIELVCKERKLPKTDRIEKLYGDTLLFMGLPDSLSIDKILNRQPKNSWFRYTQNLFCNIMSGKGVHYKEGEWYDAIALGSDRSRVTEHQYRADTSSRYADWLAFTTSMRTSVVSPGCFKTITATFIKAAYDEAAKDTHNVLAKLYHSFGSAPTVTNSDNVYDGNQNIKHTHIQNSTQNGQAATGTLSK